ncbi:hypothetical protein BY996DRAFT_1160021 [Phakopsora pachyrhizi]|nr:hypothetical protein BY996DRAFT_1160021 [Phakopsora pachyrhizi]
MEAGVFYKKTIWSIFISCLIIYSFTRGFHLSDSVKLKTKEEYFTKLDLFHHQSFKRTALSEEKISSRDIDHGLINLLEVKLKKRGVIDQITRLEDETSSGVKKIPNKKEIDVVKDVKNSDAREFSFIRKSESLNKNTVSKDFISSSRKNSFSDERTGETGEKVKIKSSSDAVTRFDNSKNPAIKSNSKNQRSDVGGRAESNIKVFDPTENYERKGKAVMFSDQGATVEDKNINNDKGDNKATVKLMKSSTMDRTSERVQSFKVSSQHDKSTGIPFIASRKITKEELLKSFREKMTLVSPPDYFEKKNNEDFHDSSRYKNFVALSKFLTYRPEFLEKLDKESQHAVKTTRKEKSGS